MKTTRNPFGSECISTGKGNAFSAAGAGAAEAATSAARNGTIMNPPRGAHRSRHERQIKEGNPPIEERISFAIRGGWSRLPRGRNGACPRTSPRTWRRRPGRGVVRERRGRVRTTPFRRKRPGANRGGGCRGGGGARG